ncbi:hypothetical protein CPT_Sansa16 [Caulobacter phage Sansa]|uniref:Uncharacterized protein n=1 Tax=Caulobacter phage Sansa TaxID=1675600 RepID=A0A0K1LMR5_9CAUD|nr:hypothetical protein HOR07_gp016 [Caulobacter phage Sansa]AKU43420.1 hypothetical protein CPT_Sansa16 [Caulobacter phage Sansa]
MSIVTLQTDSGAHVQNVQIPDLRPPARAVVWGERVFLLHQEADSSGSRAVYREIFAIAPIAIGKD